MRLFLEDDERRDSHKCTPFHLEIRLMAEKHVGKLDCAGGVGAAQNIESLVHGELLFDDRVPDRRLMGSLKTSRRDRSSWPADTRKILRSEKVLNCHEPNGASSAIRALNSLKHQLGSKPPLALATAPTKARIRGDKCRGDRSEIRSAYVCVASIVDWVVKVWSVRYPKGVSFKLKREAFRDLEVPHHAHIEVEISGSAQNVATGVAKETVEQSGGTGCDLMKR